MLLLLVLLFIVVPIAELAVIIQVGQAIGVWSTDRRSWSPTRCSARC